MIVWGYIVRVFRQSDVLVNVVFGGREYETVSARLGRGAEDNQPLPCILCHMLDLFEEDHCAKSLARTRARLAGEACR